MSSVGLKITNSSLGSSVIVNSHTDAINDTQTTDVSDTTEKIVLSRTSSDDLERITDIITSGETFGTWRIKIDGNLVVVKRSHPSTGNNVDVTFTEPIKLLNGEILTVSFEACRILTGPYNLEVFLNGYINE